MLPHANELNNFNEVSFFSFVAKLVQAPKNRGLETILQRISKKLGESQGWRLKLIIDTPVDKNGVSKNASICPETGHNH